MTITTINQNPYLRTSREFPEDLHMLTVEVNRTYLDIANTVNARTIGLFPTNRCANTGESWYIASNKRQQSFRQVYQLGNAFTNFDHNLDLESVSTFTVIRGIGYDGTNYYPLPYIGTAANQNVGLRVNSTQVQFLTGGAPPTIVSGFILLEWLSRV